MGREDLLVIGGARWAIAMDGDWARKNGSVLAPLGCIASSLVAMQPIARTATADL